jgi:hypothetical protein
VLGRVLINVSLGGLSGSAPPRSASAAYDPEADKASAANPIAIGAECTGGYGN